MAWKYYLVEKEQQSHSDEFQGLHHSLGPQKGRAAMQISKEESVRLVTEQFILL